MHYVLFQYKYEYAYIETLELPWNNELFSTCFFEFGSIEPLK